MISDHSRLSVETFSVVNSLSGPFIAYLWTLLDLIIPSGSSNCSAVLENDNKWPLKTRLDLFGSHQDRGEKDELRHLGRKWMIRRESCQVGFVPLSRRGRLRVE